MDNRKPDVLMQEVAGLASEIAQLISEDTNPTITSLIESDPQGVVDTIASHKYPWELKREQLKQKAVDEQQASQTQRNQEKLNDFITKSTDPDFFLDTIIGNTTATNWASGDPICHKHYMDDLARHKKGGWLTDMQGFANLPLSSEQHLIAAYSELGYDIDRLPAIPHLAIPEGFEGDWCFLMDGLDVSHTYIDLNSLSEEEWNWWTSEIKSLQMCNMHKMTELPVWLADAKFDALDISGNNFAIEGLAGTTARFFENGGTKLGIGGLGLDNSIWDTLAEQSDGKLQWLGLANNPGISSVNVDQLADMFPQLAYLDLSATGICQSHKIETLVDSLASQLPELKVLLLHANDFNAHEKLDPVCDHRLSLISFPMSWNADDYGDKPGFTSAAEISNQYDSIKFHGLDYMTMGGVPQSLKVSQSNTNTKSLTMGVWVSPESFGPFGGEQLT